MEKGSSFECKLYHRRETRGAHLYKEAAEGDDCTVSNVYIRKAAFARYGIISVPKEITVLVKF